MKIALEKILENTNAFKDDINAFLFDLVTIKSESGNEKAIIYRVKEEMEKVGFDKVMIDAMGNIIGSIGHGSHLIAFDSNVDTKHITESKNWVLEQYRDLGDEIQLDEQCGNLHKIGLACAVYAGKVVKNLGLEDDFTFMVTGTVQKEECAGLCWQFIIEEDNIKPEFVVLAEPTDCDIYLGHLGRLSVKITDSTGSIEQNINDLTDWNMKKDVSFGMSKMNISNIMHKDTSGADYVIVDIPLRKEESYKAIFEEVSNIPSIKEHNARIMICNYEESSFTGLMYPSQMAFPSWKLPAESELFSSLEESYKFIFKNDPKIGEWKALTNGTGIMGRHNIKCVGFGPGDHKHIYNKIRKNDIVLTTAVYALLPFVYLDDLKKRTK